MHRDWIDPLETFLELLSFAIYLRLALRTYRSYQQWLEAHLSNREEFRIVWLRNVLVAFAPVWPLWALYEILSHTIDFNYFQRFPLYVCFTLLVFYLGMGSWRHADTVYPQPSTATTEPEATTPETIRRAEPPDRDWAAQGRA